MGNMNYMYVTQLWLNGSTTYRKQAERVSDGYVTSHHIEFMADHLTTLTP